MRFDGDFISWLTTRFGSPGVFLTPKNKLPSFQASVDHGGSLCHPHRSWTLHQLVSKRGVCDAAFSSPVSRKEGLDKVWEVRGCGRCGGGKQQMYPDPGLGNTLSIYKLPIRSLDFPIPAVLGKKLGFHVRQVGKKYNVGFSPLLFSQFSHRVYSPSVLLSAVVAIFLLSSHPSSLLCVQYRVLFLFHKKKFRKQDAPPPSHLHRFRGSCLRADDVLDGGFSCEQ